MDHERMVALREALKEAGVAVSDGRFPHTYHHDWYRSENPGLDRSQVALMMHERGNERGGEWFTLATLSGALYYLFMAQPEAMAMATIHPQAGPLISGVLRDWQALNGEEG